MNNQALHLKAELVRAEGGLGLYIGIMVLSLTLLFVQS